MPFLKDSVKFMGVKAMKKSLPNIVVFVLKILMYVSLFATFFGMFSIYIPWILRLSRTAGITMVTFAVLEVLLAIAYGGYAIGKQKSKPIIYSVSIATIITDLITHLQLCIMNTNDGYHQYFVYERPWLLLLVMIVQCLLITFFTYFGHYVYFKLKSPEKSCVIGDCDKSNKELIRKISRYKKQYSIEKVIKFDDPGVYHYIDDCETVFLSEIPPEKRFPIVEYCYQRGKNIYYSFEINDIVGMGAKCYTLDDKPLVMSSIKELSFEQRIVKRAIDIVVSVIALIPCLPIMGICALAIKLDDGGKVFFKQKRATIGGRVFEVYKFRTMKEAGTINRSVTKDDDRITRVGKILRKFRVDELPQIFNIINGDMSLVGPRPEMLENVEKYTAELPEFAYRLKVKAGLTGLAQIAGKYNTSPKDKLMLDLLYIENYNVLMDIKMLLQTITVFFKSSDSTEAFEENDENLVEAKTEDKEKKED